MCSAFQFHYQHTWKYCPFGRKQAYRKFNLCQFGVLRCCTYPKMLQSWKTTTANLYIYLYKVIGQISHFFWHFHIFCISLPYFNLCMDRSWQAVYTLPLHYLIKAGLCCPSSSFAGGLAHLADIFHTCGYCAALLHHLLWLNEPFCQGA